MENISLLIAFGAGLLSFLSPCMLPMAPVYLASLSGTAELSGGTAGMRLARLWHSISFVAGLALVYSALGAIAGLTAFAINPSQAWLNLISGSLMIAFGVFLLAALKVPWLNYEKRLAAPLSGKTGYLRSFVIGAVFSLAWTACVGPVLAGILALAMNTATAWRGAYLLLVYSLGLGLPFLALGAAFDFAAPVLQRLRRYSRLASVASGLALIVVGVLALMNKLTWFASLGG